MHISGLVDVGPELVLVASVLRKGEVDARSLGVLILVIILLFLLLFLLLREMGGKREMRGKQQRININWINVLSCTKKNIQYKTHTKYHLATTYSM